MGLSLCFHKDKQVYCIHHANVQETYQQGCYKLLTACSKLVDNLQQAVRTQLVDGLFAGLLQVVRFLRVCQFPL